MTPEAYMKRALKLAARGRTSPNPMVGALVVKDGRVIGEGWHAAAGMPHAEVEAIAAAGEQSRGASLYVTLEPCCHQGRTPPCTDFIIRTGISEVYYAMPDPDPKVAGKGIETLMSHGVRVNEPTVGEAEARRLNEAYIKHRTTGLPFVILKLAMSLDGKIATRSGDSKWITGEKAKGHVHRLRSRVDAIVVGAGTARTDDPSLTARVGKTVTYPIRVVVSGSGRLDPSLKVFSQPGTSVAAVGEGADPESVRKLDSAGVRIVRLSGCGERLSLAPLLKVLSGMGCLTVLAEGGSELAGALIEQRLVDKVMFYYAPRVVGGRQAPGSVGGSGAERIDQSVQVREATVRRFGEDLLVEGYVSCLPG